MVVPSALLAACAGGSPPTASPPAASAPAPAAREAEAPYDVVITGGRIVDGTGSPWISGDVGLRGGRIAAVGSLGSAKRARTIDAKGRVVAPGFIDMLGQSELSILVDPRLPSKIHQGITTEVTGEGDSIAPLTDAVIAEERSFFEHLGVKPDWHTLAEYFARLERQRIGINFATFVGATTVRRIAIGQENRAATPAQMDEMKRMVADAMRDGAVGVSTSLMYPPAPYASTEELVALASEAGRFGGLYATHMRSESDAVLPALDETLRIGREAHVPIEIWHIKAAGKRNWGRMPEIVAKIEAARAAGQDVTADTYAYPAWSNALSAFVPPWAHEGGDARLVERLKDPKTRARIRQELMSPSMTWDNEWSEIPGPEAVTIAVVDQAKNLALQGKTLAQIAAASKKDPMDALFDLLIDDDARTLCVVFGMSEPDVALALRQPWVAVDNDSQGTSPEGVLGKEHPHPRAYGTFPRILRKYVREEKLLTLEDAIRKFSALPAARMRFADRGVIKAGMRADLVVFDDAAVRERATFDDPNQLAEGMHWVFVNGVAVIDEGKMTGALPGMVLRGPGASAPARP
jgi:dihydroorotase/N-acyl-D-amino-acid deacylase